MPNKPSWLNKWFPRPHASSMSTATSHTATIQDSTPARPDRQLTCETVSCVGLDAERSEGWESNGKPSPSPTSASLPLPLTASVSTATITRHSSASLAPKEATRSEDASQKTALLDEEPPRSSSGPAAVDLVSGPKIEEKPSRDKSVVTQCSTSQQSRSPKSATGLRMFHTLFRERQRPVHSSDSSKHVRASSTDGSTTGVTSKSPRPATSTTETSCDTQPDSSQHHSTSGWNWRGREAGRKLFGSLFDHSREREPSPPQSILLGRRGQQIERQHRKRIQRERRKKARESGRMNKAGTSPASAPPTHQPVVTVQLVEGAAAGSDESVGRANVAL